MYHKIPKLISFPWFSLQPNRVKAEFEDGRKGVNWGQRKTNLNGDGGAGMGMVVRDDEVIGQNDDVVLDFFGDALGS